MLKVYTSPSEANSYLYTTENPEGIYLIDAPGPFTVNRIIADLDKNGLSPDCILLTHAHYDHVLGLGKLLEAYPDTKVFISKDEVSILENGSYFNRMILGNRLTTDYEDAFSSFPVLSRFSFYENEIGPFQVLRTPGHTTGSVVLYDKKANIAFTGDTLFKASIGRTDIGGNDCDMASSLETISMLPKSTIILPGHGPYTDLKTEIEENPYLRR